MRILLPTIVPLLFFSCTSSPSSKTDKPLQVDSVTSVQADNSIQYGNYCNGRYDYCIDYPKSLYPQQESGNGDGRVFKDKMGDEVLRVYGSPNGEALTIDQQFENDLVGFGEADGTKGRTITYQKCGKNFYVLSGFMKGKVFYKKVILKADGFAYAILEYEEKEKDLYDKVSLRIFKSFK